MAEHLRNTGHVEVDNRPTNEIGTLQEWQYTRGWRAKMSGLPEPKGCKYPMMGWNDAIKRLAAPAMYAKKEIKR